ncbi:MAG: hypothetical protein AAFY71_20490 [Bacteroidota bacterium]
MRTRSHSIRERLDSRLLTREGNVKRNSLMGNLHRNYQINHEESHYPMKVDEEIILPIPEVDKENIEVRVIGGLLIIKVLKLTYETIEEEEQSLLKSQKRLDSHEIVLELEEEVDTSQIFCRWVNHELIIGLCKGDSAKRVASFHREIEII